MTNKIREIKEVGLKEEELKKLTPRQVAQVFVKKRVLTSIEEREFPPKFIVKGGKKFELTAELLEEGDIEEDIVRGKVISTKKIPLKRVIEIERKFPREERDISLAHELIHVIHPNWSEQRVQQEEGNFFRRDPFDDTIAFTIGPKKQKTFQLGERPFLSFPTRKGGPVSKFRFPKAVTNKGFRIQSKQRPQKNGMFTMFIKQKTRKQPKMKRMRFL